MKILCPAHPDSTPSMEVYPDGGFCFSCGAYIPIGELPNGETYKIEKKEPENIQETINRVEQLPKINQRALLLHSNAHGYYIVWPNKEFYKFRKTTENTVRYMGPRGRRPPLFWIKSKQTGNTIVVVEGELNAISLLEAYPDPSFDIASPGSANELSRHEGIYRTFKTVIIVVDNDPTGIANGFVTKELLLKAGIDVTLIPIPKDFNDILQDQGPEGLRLYFKELLR